MVKYTNIRQVRQVSRYNRTHGMMYQRRHDSLMPVEYQFIRLAPPLKLDVEYPEVIKHNSIIISSSLNDHVVAHDGCGMELPGPQDVLLGGVEHLCPLFGVDIVGEQVGECLACGGFQPSLAALDQHD